MIELDLPSSTLIYPVSPQAVGTVDVESFPSYLHRTAYEHSVNVGTLIQYVCKFSVSNDIKFKPPLYIWPNELVRPHNTTKNIVSAFENATMQKLTSGVFQFFDEAIGMSPKEIIKNFKWCPECIREMESLGQKTYFKLIWHLTEIRYCPTHRSPLIEECEFCGCDQKSYKRKCEIGRCQECGRSLSTRKRKLSFRDIRHSWEDIGFDLIDFFTEMAQDWTKPLPVNGLQHSFDAIYEYYCKNDREVHFYALLNRTEKIFFHEPDRKLSLLSIRRIAHSIGISIYSLLSGEAAQTVEHLDPESAWRVSTGFMEATKKTKKDHIAILSRIRRYLRNCDSPPSLKQLAGAVEVSVGYLEYRHPVLVADVVAKHKTHVETTQYKKIQAAQNAALRFFIDEKYSGFNKSRKQAYKTIREETGLPKFMLRKAIQASYQAIFENHQ